MFKYKIYFKLGKFDKAVEKIGTSVEDAWYKLERDYRFAAKRPVLIKYDILEIYYDKIDYHYTGPNEYEKEMDRIRETTEFTCELLEMLKYLKTPVNLSDRKYEFNCGEV